MATTTIAATTAMVGTTTTAIPTTTTIGEATTATNGMAAAEQTIINAHHTCESTREIIIAGAMALTKATTAAIA